MAGKRTLARTQLLLCATALLFVADWLPGGLLPVRRRLTERSAKHATASGRPLESVPVPEFRLDAAGRLLLPNCGERNATSAERTLLRVRCSGTGRAVVVLGEASGFLTKGLRAVDLVQAAVAASDGKSLGLVCAQDEATVVAKCLPIVARAMKELAPRAYRVHVQKAWKRGIRNGAMICCDGAEERKALPDVDASKCGVKCNVERNTPGKVEKLLRQIARKGPARDVV